MSSMHSADWTITSVAIPITIGRPNKTEYRTNGDEFTERNTSVRERSVFLKEETPLARRRHLPLPGFIYF